MKVYNPEEHYHVPGDGSWWIYDARGIEVARVCAVCEPHKRLRKEVMENPNYEADEQIEPD